MRWALVASIPLLVFPSAMLFGAASCGPSYMVADEGPDVVFEAAPPFALSSLNQPCETSSLTGQTALDRMKPQYDAIIIYQSSTGAPEAELRIFLTYANGAITCVPNANQPSITVAVSAKITTSDGTFNESLEGTVILFASSATKELLPDLGFAASEPVSAVTGTFTPTLTGTSSAHTLQFKGTLTASEIDAAAVGGSNGSVLEMVTSTQVGVGTWH
jgi:hypothetical protein